MRIGMDISGSTTIKRVVLDEKFIKHQAPLIWKYISVNILEKETRELLTSS